MTSFPLLPFGDLYSSPSRNGVTVPKGARDSGVRMINMGELFRFDRICDDEMARVPLNPNELLNSLVQTGDLLFARRSLKLSGAGRCSLVGPASEPRTFESSIIRVRLNPALAVPEFYFYYFKSQFGRETMNTIVEQAVVAGIRASDLRALPVPVPPIEVQRSIAATLGALDDKIESNKQLISTILELTSAIIEQQISREHKLVPVSSLARFVNGGAYTKNATGNGRMVIRIAELNKGPGSSTIYNDLEVPEDRLARAGDILMSWSGSLGVYRWTLDEAIVNQHIFKVIPIGFPSWLVFNRIEAAMPTFKRHAADKATTMGHIQRGHLDSTEIAIPSNEVLAILEKKIEPLWQKLIRCEQEIINLTLLRDALLSELISGSIQFDEADK